jgi:hypothetical protein
MIPVLRGGQGTPHQSPENQDLVIHMSSPKNSYEIGSSIPLRIEILNRSQRQLLVGFLLDEVAGVSSSIKIHVLDSNNREMTARYRLHLSPYGQDWGHGWWIPLEAGYFYGRETYLTPKIYPFLNEVGQYRLFVTYAHEATDQNEPDDKSGQKREPTRSTSTRIFIGKIQSDPIEIQITGPNPGAH